MSRGWIKTVLIAVALVATVAGLLFWGPRRGPSSEVDDQSNTAVWVQVEQRSLIEEVLVRAEVTGAPSRAVRASGAGPSSGRQVLTRVPAVGDVVDSGGVLFAVSDRPVFALDGEVGLYRRLAFGDAGPDVARFQVGLAAAGFDLAVSGIFDDATSAAVGQLYLLAGFSAPTPAAEDVQQVAQLESERDAMALAAPPVAASVRADLTRRLVDARKRLGPSAVASEFEAAGTLPARVVNVGASLGSLVSDGDEVLAVASGEPVIEVVQPDSARSLDGYHAVVRSMDGTIEVDAVISSKAADSPRGEPSGESPSGQGTSIQASASDSDEEAADGYHAPSGRIEVVSAEIGRFEPGSFVMVSVEVASSPATSLVVPSAALIGASDGSFLVERRVSPTDDFESVPVNVVVRADGSVALGDGSALRVGDQVRVYGAPPR